MRTIQHFSSCILIFIFILFFLAGKRSKRKPSSNGKDKAQPSCENEDSFTNLDNLQGQAINCILEDIQHDCDIASALQS